ncbi:MAG: AsmA-like C-terminal domain-containing protein [Planctomycetota bacterium]
MSFSAGQQRRMWWRRFIERRSLNRHPVSLTRQRAGVALLIALLLGLSWYACTTRDESIRERAVKFLTEATAGEVEVGRAHFEMFRGITLYDVRVSTPYDEQFDPTAVAPAERRIFSASSVQLIHNPWRLLFGSLRVERIVATKPTIILAHNIENGIRNWQLLATNTDAQSESGTLRPRITLRSAKAIIVSIDRSGRRETTVEELDADVRPHPQAEAAYCIDVRRFTDPAERTMVVFDPGKKLVTNTPFVSAKTIRLQLSKPVQRFFDRIGLDGEVKLGRMVYDTQRPEEWDTRIELRSVRCAVPLSLLRSDVSPARGALSQPAASPEEDGVIEMTDVKGTLNLMGNRLALDISGLINGAECRMNGHLDRVGHVLEEVGINLAVQGVRVPFPEGTLRERLMADSKAPKLVREILIDYQPHGEFDVNIRLARKPGADARLVVSGRVEPMGAIGSCQRFPYKIEDIHGALRFESDKVLIENLHGRHGPALVRVDGVVDRSTDRSSVDVKIEASAVPFDVELFEAISERFRSFWQRFNPRGSAHVTVLLKREGAGPDEPMPKFRSYVTADLMDARVAFTEYPYPLEDVHGTLEIQPDGIQFIGLTGHHDAASARIDGYVSFDDQGKPQVELRIEANNMRLDQTLASALPPEGRGAFAQFQPDGYVDLLGAVSLHDSAQGVTYDMRTKVREAEIRYRELPYAVHDVHGEINIRPEAITLVDVSGRHGDAEVTAGGTVHRLDDGYAADLVFDWKRLPLDEALFDTLPEQLKRVWRLLEPTGSIQVRTVLHHVQRDGRTQQHHRSEITTEGAKLRFQGFPLPLSDVAGHVLVTDQQVEFVSLTGRVGQAEQADKRGEITLSGTLDLTPPGRRGTLKVTAKDMLFTEELLAAMPPRLQEALTSLKPTGRFNLQLDPLHFDIGADGKTRWDFDGEIEFVDAGMNLGFDLRHVAGALRGRGSIGEEGTSIEARTELSSVVMAGWPLENVLSSIVSAPGAGVILVQDASAEVYGGEATGFAEVRLNGRHTTYQISIAARDLQLRQYLAAESFPRGAEDEKARAARGSVYGNLILRGRSGKGGYREGVGELFVREAQVWKLPLVFAVFQVLNLSLDENVFHDGWLKFYLTKDTLTFQHIDLQGRAVSLVGGGRMDLPTKRLDITLLAGSPMRIRVPFLTDILDGVAREVMEIRVSGTLQKPKITPQPLKSLTTVLKTLFPEPPRSTDR